MHMPAHVVLHDDVRRSDAAIRELQELLIGQKRKKEAAKNASRPGTERRARERRRDREARQARRAQLARDSRRSPQLESASPDGSSAESEAFERAPEDVQAILRYRERRQSVLCERPPAAPEERERTHVDWKPVVTVSFQRSKETPSRPPEEEPPTESLSMENDLSSRARRLVFRQKQKSALDRSAIRADRRAHKEFASMLRDLARMQLIKEGDRIAEMVRLKDEKLIKEDFHRYDEDGNGMLQLTEIRGVLEDAGLLPQNDEEKASVRRTIVNMALQVPDGETDEEKELEEAKGNVLLVHQKQERLARDLELSREQMPELLERIRRRLKIAQQKAYFSHFTKYDLFDEGEMDIQDVLKLLQELKLLPDLDEARGDFARWLLTIVKGRSETNKVQSVASEDLASKKRAAVKSRMPRASTRSVTERPASRERPNSRERPSSKEGDEDLEDRDPPRPMSKGLRPAQTHHDKVDFLLEERERPDAVALEDLPRLLPDMKFDKFEFEVMADFLSEAHGRLTAQQQIELAEQLGLGKALFQEFRKELEAMIELFYSFDDTHSGVVKKVEVWVALSNLGLLPCLDQNKVEMLVMISLACTDAAANPAVARFSGQVPRNSQRWLGTKAALKALLQSSEFLQLASQVGSLDEGCMDFARFLYLVHSVRLLQSRALREDLVPIFERMLRRRKKTGKFSVNAVGIPEVSQALEALHLGPKQREDQKKITEFLNDVNEFGFSPLTLDFEAFVRFVRQVKEWQAICTRAADRAYGADLGLQERMVDEFRVIFDIIDSSGSGELDLLGVKRACGLLGQKSLSFEELRKIFETLDKDGSGAIDFLEFLHMTNMANLGKPKGRATINANAAIFAPFGWSEDR